MVHKLPTIKFKNKEYIYDYRLSELRTAGEKSPIKFIALNNTENELLDYAIKNQDKSLIKINMKDLEWKL